MSNKDLEAKLAYYNEHGLLDLSDDEFGFPDEGFLQAERALADTKAMPPPPPATAKLVRQRSSFLGPTPKERQAEFVAYTAHRRDKIRPEGSGQARPATAPESSVTQGFPSVRRKGIPSSSPARPRSGLKHSMSLPDLVCAGRTDQPPFYKRVGVVPRELRSGKSVKPADNIKLDPEHKQLLRGKVVYFYPNDDVSMARRHRIHKIIQLGAAWVTQWRDDISHIMVDDANYTYTQLLKHFNRAGLPRKVILVKFDPYVPQCIQLGLLLEPNAGRFLVKGAPKLNATTHREPSPSPSVSSQGSLQIKPSKRQLAAHGSQKTDSVPGGDSLSAELPITEPPLNSPVDIVKDSFIHTSSDPAEPRDLASDQYDDELTQAIKQTKAVAHLPIDEEDSDVGPNVASTIADASDTDTDNESQEPAIQFKKNTKRSATPIPCNQGKASSFNQSNFQCMNPGATADPQNPNARTIEVLDQMCKYYDQMQDQWRTLAYRKGIATLRKQERKINTKEEAAALPFIGSRLAEKIEEIVLTDRLRRLDNTRDDPADKVLRLFLGIYGVGLSQAHKWIQAGHRTIEDLIQEARLTETQKIGIEHYDDFAARITRSEVEAHGAFVRRYLRILDARCEVTIMGSYRRGAKDSGDIDLIITRPQTPLSTLRTIVFQRLVPQLFKLGFLKAALATSHRTKDGSKWHGASCLPGSRIWRRLDLLLVPEGELGAALIYFTGNDIFNRSLRLLANKKGMRLNQRGLYKDVIRGKHGERLNEGTLVEGQSEKKIFEILGVPWRTPEERIC